MFMRQVRILSCSSAGELEKDINGWLKNSNNSDKVVIDIQFQYRPDKVFNHCAMIVYEVK